MPKDRLFPHSAVAERTRSTDRGDKEAAWFFFAVRL